MGGGACSPLSFGVAPFPCMDNVAYAVPNSEAIVFSRLRKQLFLLLKNTS